MAEECEDVSDQDQADDLEQSVSLSTGDRLLRSWKFWNMQTYKVALKTVSRLKRNVTGTGTAQEVAEIEWLDRNLSKFEDQVDRLLVSLGRPRT